MYKINNKRIMISAFLILILFSFMTIVWALPDSTSYSFNGDGRVVEVESQSKLKGTVDLKATTDFQYYRGQLRFILYKKGLFGYKEYEDRQYIDTYGRMNILAYWYNCGSAYYKGQLQLYDIYDGNSLASISGNFSIHGD